jgi:hypothetical protein
VTDCPRDELGRSVCAEQIRALIREYAELLYPGVGCEAIISTVPPVRSVYKIEAHRCPHGTVYYCEPTSEQIMRWAELEIE